MNPTFAPLVFAVLLLLGMLLMLEIGRRVGIRRRPTESEGERGSLGTIEGAIFALFGLLMAFTFSGAANRFNEKRMLIIEEVNAIETAYLRVGLAPAETQAPLRELFRHYVDARIETYRQLPDMVGALRQVARSREIQEEIWSMAEAVTRHTDAHIDAGKLLLPALNAMFDMASTRTMAWQVHPPEVIYVLLYCLGLICSLLAGYRMSIGPKRSWMHILGFTVMTVVITFVILDIEFPRSGLIRLAHSEQAMLELRERMK